MSFGNKLKELRKEKNWSQDEFAEKIEGGGRHVSKYENEKTLPSAEVIMKIATVFNVSVDYLLFDDIPKSPLKYKHRDLISKMEQLEDITEDDKKAMIAFIDAFIAKYQIRKIVNQS